MGSQQLRLHCRQRSRLSLRFDRSLHSPHQDHHSNLQVLDLSDMRPQVEQQEEEVPKDLCGG